MIFGPVSEARGHATPPVYQLDREPARLSKAGAGVAVVAGEGIGASIARRAAAEGFTTVMVACNLERLRRVAVAIEQAGGTIRAPWICASRKTLPRCSKMSSRSSALHELFPDMAAGLPEDGMMKPADIADTYLWLHNQPRSAWSFEIDLRPWAERF